MCVLNLFLKSIKEEVDYLVSWFHRTLAALWNEIPYRIFIQCLYNRIFYTTECLYNVYTMFIQCLYNVYYVHTMFINRMFIQQNIYTTWNVYDFG